MAKIIKLGSICFDGNQTVPGSELFEQQFSIEDTCPGMELQWVDDGTKIISDGKSYLCRCLKVGNNENIPREWDTLLDKYGEDNNLWHWENKYFWGQESAQSLVSGHVMRAVRGYRSARDWSCCNPTGRYTINFNWTIRQAGKIVVSKDDIIGIKKIQL